MTTLSIAYTNQVPNENKFYRKSELILNKNQIMNWNVDFKIQTHCWDWNETFVHLFMASSLNTLNLDLRST